jgi:hypothetical protein
VTRGEGERRRYYQLTGDGRAVDELARLQTLVRRVRARLPKRATA